MQNRMVGRPVPRKEGRAKVTGAARYVDDISLPEMLYGTTVRSPVPRGRINRHPLRHGASPGTSSPSSRRATSPAQTTSRSSSTTSPTSPTASSTTPKSPSSCSRIADKYLLEEARRAVRLEIEPLPAVFNIEESLAGKEIIWGEDNIFKTFLVEKGNVDEVWAAPDVIVVEGEYRTGAQEQLYIETNGVIAEASPADGRHRVGLDAVPLLRPQGAGETLRPAGG